MICRITPTIMDGIVVSWSPDDDDRAEVSASRNGVLVYDWPMLRVEIQRVVFDRVVSTAWEMYRLLAKAAERGPFVRMETEDVRAWLVERGERIVDVRFGESLDEALKREQTETPR
jgi:predicted GNAT superfamily acetyltransferase